MRTILFTDQFAAAASVAGSTVEELMARDEERSIPWLRWLAIDDEAVAMATAFLRPDDRWFLSFIGNGSAGYPELIAAAADEIDAPLYTSVEEDATEVMNAMTEAGFVTEVVNESFRVRFSVVLSRLKRAWLPTACQIIDVAQADADRLLALDNDLRGSVPGVEGWRGDRTLFDDDITDASSYKVAVCDGDYVGLARMWNNPSGPSFGLVGVTKERRGGTLAGALLKEVFMDASQWGYDWFTAGTSLTNVAVHDHLSDVGESLGTSAQMVRF